MSVLLPEVGTRVFCFLQDAESNMRWYEREVLKHNVQPLGEGRESHKIIVASARTPGESDITDQFVRADSDEGRYLLHNNKAVLMD